MHLYRIFLVQAGIAWYSSSPLHGLREDFGVFLGHGSLECSEGCRVGSRQNDRTRQMVDGGHMPRWQFWGTMGHLTPLTRVTLGTVSEDVFSHWGPPLPVSSLGFRMILH